MINPILFNTSMVQAILEGHKKQTRRVIKGAKHYDSFIELSNGTTLLVVDKFGEEQEKDVNGLWATFEWDGCPECPMEKSSYQPGDILWVRETFLPFKNVYYYKADNKHLELETLGIRFKWRPSIHMPRAAARLFLRVKSVRVERVQDISEVDAKAEGIRSYWLTKEAGSGADDWHESNGFYVGTDNTFPTRKEAFRQLWDSLNAKQGYGWDTNPWVWVYEFEKTEVPNGEATS